MHNPSSILVYVYEDLLGDGVLKLPFVYTLRKNFPDAHITWCAGGGKSLYARSLAPLIQSQLDEVLELPLGRSWTELIGPSPLKNRFFDLIIDTQRNLKTTLALKKIPHKKFVSRTARFFFSDIKPLKGHHPRPHISDQIIFLLEVVVGKPLKPESYSNGFLVPFQKAAGKIFAEKKPYIGLAPGAGNRKKCWPLERFVELAYKLEEKEMIPVFILGPQEEGWYEDLKKAFPRALFPLQEHPLFLSAPFYTSALGSFLKAAVVNDAGVAHLLSLSNTRLVSLFGPTTCRKTKPLSEKVVAIEACQFSKTKDMRAISVSVVLSALETT